MRFIKRPRDCLKRWARQKPFVICILDLDHFSFISYLSLIFGFISLFVVVAETQIGILSVGGLQQQWRWAPTTTQWCHQMRVLWSGLTFFWLTLPIISHWARNDLRWLFIVITSHPITFVCECRFEWGPLSALRGGWCYCKIFMIGNDKKKPILKNKPKNRKMENENHKLKLRQRLTEANRIVGIGFASRFRLWLWYGKIFKCDSINFYIISCNSHAKSTKRRNFDQIFCARHLYFSVSCLSLPTRSEM